VSTPYSRSAQSPRWLVLLLMVAVLGLAPLPDALGGRAASAAAIDCPCSIWPSSATPATASVSDSGAVELGVRFSADVDGFVSGIRFYKGAANTGTHVGKLWSSSGDLLDSATFANETDSGWQQVSFGAPIPVTAGATYIASYHAPNGGYAIDGGYFSAPQANGPLTAQESTGSSGNGVFLYGSGGFPTNTWNASNYWVDVVFDIDESDTTRPTVTERSPAADATNVSASADVTAKFNEPIQAGSAALVVTGPAGTVTGSTGYDIASRTVRFSPAASLAESTTYSVTVTSAEDPAGNLMLPLIWSFTTGVAQPPGSCPCSIWSSSAVPDVASVADSNAVELGVKFRASEAGFITGIRFYKGAANTGTHVGRLWKSDGTLLKEATFTAETTGGWQQVIFSAPQEIDPDVTYIATYHAPTGRYALTSTGFAGATTAGPLTALQNDTNDGNGVYRYGPGGVLPTNTWNASNYWVDVVFTDALPPDPNPPTVTGRTPPINASDVSPASPVRATFSEPVQPDSVEVSLSGPGGSVNGTRGYDAGTMTATFTPTVALSPATTYTATVSGAKDAAGNSMTAVVWSFTTAAASPPDDCPCTIWPSSSAPDVPSAADDSATEVGVKFQASKNGLITGVRFYKGAANTGTHTGNLWTANGIRLATGVFTDETPSGWQQMTFSAPVPIVAGRTYVASYHALKGRYALSSDYFLNGAVASGPLTALQNGLAGGNGVYRYGPSSFPTASFAAGNYWVDVVFDREATDTIAPTAIYQVPAPALLNVPIDAATTVNFSEPVQEATIDFELRGPSGTAVPATLTYDGEAWKATLTPQSPLAYSTAYTAHLSGAKDAAGTAMAPLSWTFTTRAAPPPPPDQGPGGPIAVLSSSDKFTRYTAEILRAEGLNEFAVLDMGSVTAGTLASYDVAVLGSMALTAEQVALLTDWVNAGGNLIAYRPDPQLASLLGIAPAGGTATDTYLRVDNAQPAGAGITGETIQFHGPADLYNLNGATAVATLHTNALEATPYPAVTLRSVGGSGGQAAAFTYDLARSVVYTRQGNPAWAGEEKDGALGADEARAIRTNDLFYPDWIDLAKVAIPQADEQQRLLANLVEVTNRDRIPLPRFWYFPAGHKAVVVATGDDHARGGGGTSGRFDQYVANSTPGCSVADWECLRFTSYVDPASTMNDVTAVDYENSGFEVALHPFTDCADYEDQATLASVYQVELGRWNATFPSVSNPVTNRFHCLVWSDWSSQPKVESANGMRLDVNYYYWSGAWIQNKPGFMTGSGMPMRFADLDGTMIDVYQAPTQMTDESQQSYPFTPDTLLGNALGPLGYYGAFVANIHTDNVHMVENDLLMASAQDHEVPMITAKQLLTWLDGRNSSSFDSVGWSGDTLSFAVDAHIDAKGLQAMVPTAGPGGATLSGLARGGAAVTYKLQTIKGLEYAVFPAVSGSYEATYSSSGGGSAPTIAAAQVSSAPDGTADMQWRTSEPATSEIVFGMTPESLGSTSVEAGASRTHAITLGDLRPGATYYYRVRSRDLTGTRTTWPPTSQEPLAFTTPKKDNEAPAISAVKVRPLPDGTATVKWATSEPATSAVSFGESAGALRGSRIDNKLVRQHAIVLTRLKPGQTYWYRVASSDAAGNNAETAGNRPMRFLSSAPGVADQTTAKFRMGSRSGVIVEDPTAASTGQLALSEKRRTGRYVSRVMDAGAMVTWDRGTWRPSLPKGATVRVQVRTGSTATPDGSWTSWQRLSGPGDVIAMDGRYLQYRVEFVGGPVGVPKLSAVGFTHNGSAPATVGEIGD
jgi:hypothetical protein